MKGVTRISNSMRFFTLYLFILCRISHAATPLTWEQCVSIARAHNPDLAAAGEAVHAAQSGLKASYSGFFPQLSANGIFTHGNSGGGGSSSLLIPGGSNTIKDNYSLGINATEQLFSGFRDEGKIKEAKANLESLEAAFQIAEAKLGFDLKSAFAQLLYSEKNIGLTEDIARRREGNLRLVKLRFEGGRENKGSYLLSSAAFSQASFDNAQARRAVTVAEKLLIRLLERAETEKISVQGELTTRDPSPTPDFISLAQSTPDFRQADAQWLVAQAQAQEARALFFPEVDFNASVSRQGDHFFPDTNRWSVGLSLSFPFFPGTQNIFNYESARATERKTELVRRSTQDQMWVKLQQAHSGFIDAIGQYHVAEEFLIAAESRATIARGRYTTGLMTFEDWDLIENDLINREKQALAGRRDAVLAEATWEQTQGKGALP
jgi:outer membrane protein